MVTILFTRSNAPKLHSWGKQHYTLYQLKAYKIQGRFEKIFCKDSNPSLSAWYSLMLTIKPSFLYQVTAFRNPWIIDINILHIWISVVSWWKHEEYKKKFSMKTPISCHVWECNMNHWEMTTYIIITLVLLSRTTYYSLK